MKHKPLVSIVIPTYNHEQYLARAIKSVLKQTHKNAEIIICDDGSSDNTKEVIKKFKHHKKIRYYYQSNQGLASTRNLGIKKAKGEFIAFLDSDDYWLPKKIEKQLKIFTKNKQIGLVYCFHYWVSEAGKITGKKKKNYRGDIWQDLLQGNLIVGSGSAAVVKKECFDKIGLFDESLKSCEDWDMWLRIARVYQIDLTPELLVKITQHPHKIKQQKWSLARGRFKVIKKNLSYLPEFNKKGIANFLKSVKILILELILK